MPTIPGYRLIEKLAQGGMGVVFVAVDDTLGRKVAIKMIRPELGDDDSKEQSVGRFLREARAAARIQSSHVAQVLQFGECETGELYLVLEYLAGKTLSDVLRKERRLAPARAVKIARQVCRGLKAAHDLQIVHRDLKPSNIMLLEQDGDPEHAKILDFGVAKLLGEAESHMTQTGSLVGTYTSMAPEQVNGGTIDARTDVYALGVLLFRMITGRAPFEGHDPALVLHHHVFKAPPRPSSLVLEGDVSPALDEVILRCLAKDMNDRPADMAVVDRLLGEALDRPAEQREPGFAEKATALFDPGVTAKAEIDDGAFVELSSFGASGGDDGEVFADSHAAPHVPTSPDAETRLARPTRDGDPPTPLTQSPLAKAPLADDEGGRRLRIGVAAAGFAVVAVVVASGAVVAMLIDRWGGGEAAAPIASAPVEEPNALAEPAAPSEQAAATSSAGEPEALPDPPPEVVDEPAEGEAARSDTAEPAKKQKPDRRRATAKGERPAKAKRKAEKSTTSPEPSTPGFVRVRTEGKD